MSDFNNMSFEELENLSIDDVLAMNPGDVETSNVTPEMTAVWVCNEAKTKAVKREDKPNMLRVELQFEAREVRAVGDPNRNPADLVGRKHTESFDVTSEMGLGMLVGLLCRIAGVDADDKAARSNLGGTVGEVVKELATGQFAFVGKIGHRESGGRTYGGFTLKPSDFSPA